MNSALEDLLLQLNDKELQIISDSSARADNVIIKFSLVENNYNELKHLYNTSIDNYINSVYLDKGLSPFIKVKQAIHNSMLKVYDFELANSTSAINKFYKNFKGDVDECEK